MKHIIRWAVLGALFAIPFIPLYVEYDFFFPFITGKHFAFRILVEIAFVGWILLAFTDSKYRPRFSWTLLIYGLLVGWMLIANFFAINPHKAFWSNYERMDGWITLVHVFALFLVAGSVLTVENLWRKWWLTFVGASVFVLGYGLLQILGIREINQGGVRLDATFGNAIYLAVYLLFVTAIALWLGSTTRKKMMRNTLYVLAALQTWMLFLTATRGALLGAGVAIFIGATLWILSSSGKARRIGAGVLVGLGILGGTFFLVKDAAWVQSEPTLARLTSISLADGSTRFTLWDMALKGAMERPVFGWGQEGFNYVFSKHYEPTLYTQEPWFDRAHNMFIDWLIAGGIPAFLLFIALLGSGVYALYRKGEKRERVFLIAVLGAYAFQGLFVFDNLFAYVPVAMILAMAHASSSRPWEQVDALPVLSNSAFQTTAAPIGIAVALLLVWNVNVPSMRAANDLIYALADWPDARTNLVAFENALSRGSFATQELREHFVTKSAAIAGKDAVPVDIRDEITRRALEEMAKEVARAPHDARLRLEYMYAYRSRGDFENALKELAIAQSLSPKKQSLIIEEGVLYWQVKDYERASAAFARAYALSPQIEDIAAYHAAGLIVTKNLDEAEAILTQHFGTTTVTHGIVVLAYYETRNFAKVIPALILRAEGSNDSSAYLQLANAYIEAGRVKEAQALLREMLTLFPDLSTQIMAILTSIGTR